MWGGDGEDGGDGRGPILILCPGSVVMKIHPCLEVVHSQHLSFRGLVKMLLLS